MIQIKSHLEKKISDADKKIPDTNNLVKKIDLDARVSKIESKIPSITGLATNSASTAVENKIPDVSSFVKKQIMIQKLLKLKVNILLYLITIFSLKTLLIIA